MTIQLQAVNKSFMVSGRSHRPLYRELINLGSRVESALTRFPSSQQIVLHASHDHELMLRTCPQAILIDGGTIRHFGTTEEVLHHYQRESGT